MARPVHIAVIVTDYPMPGTAGSLERWLKSAGIDEALVIETQEGIDVHAMWSAAPARLGTLLEEHAGLDLAKQTLTGADALRRLLAVAASQAHIRLAESHRRAWNAGLIGDSLHDRLQLAYRTARNVRRVAAPVDRPVSIVSTAVTVAHSIHGDLSRVRGLLIGTEEAGEMIAARLVGGGLAGLAVMHERLHRAREAAERLGARSASLADIGKELAVADILILSAGTGHHAVTVADLEAALAVRRRKPVFLVDAGVPPDADPAIEELDDVFVYTLDHLEQLVLEDRSDGVAELPSVLVEEAVASFSGSARRTGESHDVEVILTILEDARRRVLAAAPDADAFESTGALVDHLAERAEEALAGSSHADELVECARRLFDRVPE